MFDCEFIFGLLLERVDDKVLSRSCARMVLISWELLAKQYDKDIDILKDEALS